MRRSGIAAPSLRSHGLTCTLPNRGLTELSLIRELIRGIVQEQGRHFISSLLWALPALCSLHQPRPLAWAVDIKLPVAAGNLPVRTFPFTTRLTDLGPSLPPISHHVSGWAELLLGLNAALCQHQGVSAQARLSGTQESQAPSHFHLADKVAGGIRSKAHSMECSPEQAGRTLKRVPSSLRGRKRLSLLPLNLVLPALTHLPWKPPRSHRDDVSEASLCVQARL